VDQDQNQDFALEPLPCILLVDDDNNSPNVRSYFRNALDNMGYDYDVFDVGTGAGNGPSLAEMQHYSIIIWFSGDKYGANDLAGPNSADEANLAAYLDGGGMLFLSSQDYLYDMGATSFGQNYLGIGSYTNDKGHATTKYGLAGDPIGGGLGPYALDYPDNFDDWGDIVNANVGASVAFRSSATGGNNLDADKDGGNWRTVFFGTSWVPIYNESAANGEEVLQRIIDWFGGCAPNEGVLLGQVTDALSGVPVAGVEVTVRPSSRDTRREAILAGTGPSGRYTLTLTADIYDVTASKPGYYTQTATGIEVQAGMTTTQDLALQPMAGIAVDPLALEATLYNETSADQTLSLTNTSTTEMTFTLREESRTAVLVERQDNLAVLAPPAAGIAFDVPWLSEDPISGTLAPGEGRPITVTFDASGMAAGTYLGLLDVESSDLVSPHIGIPATLTVEFCDPVKIHEVITHTQGCTASFSADVSGTTPYSYAWDFGLFGDSTEPAPVVDFYADGTYPYTLTTHNCNATFSDMITGTVTTDCGIWCAPVRVITVTPNISGCAVTLDADLWGSPPYTYTWDLGEYGLYHEPTPEVDFTATGTYPYSLTTENCGAVFSDTMTGTLEVACQPHLYLPVVLRGE
jgi:hypothetical protein